MSAAAAVLLGAAVLCLPGARGCTRGRARQVGVAAGRATGRPRSHPPGSRVRVVGFAAVIVVLGLVVVGGVGTAVRPGAWQVCAGGALGAAVWWRRRRQRRARAREEAEADVVAAAEVLVGELRAGAHPVAACGQVAEDPATAGGPVGRTLATAVAAAQLGGALAAGIDLGARRHGGPVREALRRLAGAWALAERHGLAVAEILDRVRADAAAAADHAREVDAALAGPRATAVVLAALPVVGVCFGEAVGAHPLALLLSGGLGGMLLCIGVTLVVAGLLWTDAIVDHARHGGGAGAGVGAAR